MRRTPTMMTLFWAGLLPILGPMGFVGEAAAQPQADIAITSKTVDKASPFEGATVTYTVIAANNGPANANGVQVTDLLPAGVTFQSSTVTAGLYTSGTGLWDIGSMSAGASETLTITAAVDAGTGGSTIINTASVSAVDQTDTNPANDSDTASIAVQKQSDDIIALLGGGGS